MHFRPEARDRTLLPHDPIKAIVAPRPIGWISALGRDGALNLSPYSFFNLLSSPPVPIVMFSSEGKKDAVSFVEETGEFTCSLATFDMAQQMSLTSAPLPRGTSEFGHAGLETEASELVKPPRVKGTPAALECKLISIQELTDINGRKMDTFMVLGQVIGVYIDERYVVAGRFDMTKARTIARCGYSDYAVVNQVFSIQRPPGAGG
jgi:flavin reductase (DIM6/NTAB) family NADH-FMN oxidoreductase RutF